MEEMKDFLTMTYVNRKTADSMADEADNKTPVQFEEKYGIMWFVRYAYCATALFIREALNALDRKDKASVEVAKKYIDIRYLKHMFDINDMNDLYVGDVTMDILINTFLLAFINDGTYPEDDEPELIELEGYKIINGDYCKYHSKYKGWELYRAWNVQKDHGKMRYFAVKDDDHWVMAGNLSGIKDKVSEEC